MARNYVTVTLYIFAAVSLWPSASTVSLKVPFVRRCQVGQQSVLCGAFVSHEALLYTC